MKNFDFIGSSIKIHYNGNKDIKTGFGGIVFFITLSVAVFLFIAFGEDFYKRKNPYFYTSVTNMEDYPFKNITNKDLNFMFYITDSFQQIIDEPESLFPVIRYTYRESYNSFDEEKIMIPQKCNENDLNDEIKNKNPSFKNFYCMKMNNITLGGSYSNIRQGSIGILIGLCKAGEKNPLYKDCNSQEHTDRIFDKLPYINIYVQEAILQPNNYTNGIQKSLISLGYSIDRFIFKDLKIFLKQVTLETDYGWLLKNLHQEELLSLDYYFLDLRQESTMFNILFSTAFFINKNVENNFRQYQKIQNVAAEVGGILKIIVIIASYIVDNYNKSYMFLNFMYHNPIYKEKLHQLNPKINKSNIEKNYNDLSEIKPSNLQLNINNVSRYSNNVDHSKEFKISNINYSDAILNENLKCERLKKEKEADNNKNVNLKPYKALNNLFNNELNYKEVPFSSLISFSFKKQLIDVGLSSFLSKEFTTSYLTLSNFFKSSLDLNNFLNHHNF